MLSPPIGLTDSYTRVGLAVVGDALYFGSGSGLYSTNKNSTPPTPAWTARTNGLVSAGTLAVEGGKVYFTAGHSGSYGLYEITPPGDASTPTQPMATTDAGFGSNIYGNWVAATSDAIFFTAYTKIYKADSNGGNVTLVYDYDNGYKYIQGLATDGTFVYFTDAALVRSISASTSTGGTATVVAAGRPHAIAVAPSTVNANTHTLYWIDGPKQIMKLELSH